ncbi:stealth family protein [Brachybacterium squillarum]|uniref:stealth family protein n=1 Tax=Brachybacterium squillarum TaxID=661979 RepID=UPI0002DCB739|nr:stealth family protein [Brachybacterium squillarum]
MHQLTRDALAELRAYLAPVPTLLNADYPRFSRHIMVREGDATDIETRLQDLPPHWEVRRNPETDGWTLHPRFAVDGAPLPCDSVLPVYLDVMRRDGSSYRSGSLGGLSGVDASSWERLARTGEYQQTETRAFDIGAPIDLVYTWVDGHDPAWQRRFRSELATLDASPALTHPSAVDTVRFDDSQELRHSLRSVHQFANWVRRIHIVTDGQVPAWLDTGHPRIHLVDHHDIMGGSRYNSHAIEASLHRIPGLAEHYLYLNDDVFFGRAAFPSDFFVKDGMARFFPSDLPIDPGPATADDLPIMAAAKNGRDLIREDFGLECGTRIRHTVHPQLKSVNLEIERRHPERIAQVRASRFRATTDLSLAASLHHWFGFARGTSVPGTANYLYLNIDEPHAGQALDAVLAQRRHDTFCLNREISHAHGDRAATDLVRFLARYFPHRAPWELSEVGPRSEARTT